MALEAPLYRLFWTAPDGLTELEMGLFAVEAEAGAAIPAALEELRAQCATDAELASANTGRWSIHGETVETKPAVSRPLGAGR